MLMFDWFPPATINFYYEIQNRTEHVCYLPGLNFTKESLYNQIMRVKLIVVPLIIFKYSLKKPTPTKQQQQQQHASYVLSRKRYMLLFTQNCSNRLIGGHVFQMGVLISLL